MSEQISVILAVVSFLIAGLIAKKRNSKTIEGFSTNKNSLSWFVTSAGVSMTFVGGAALINMASLGYSFGWDTLIDPFAMFTGVLIACFFVKKYRSDKGVTMSELLSSNYKPLSIYIGLISTLIFLLICSAQFVAFAKLLSPYFTEIHPTILVIIPSAIILLYVFIGGFSAVTNTDVLQLFFILIFLLIPVSYFIVTFPTPIVNSDFKGFSSMPLDLMVLLCISILYIPTSQDMNIRAKSAKSDKIAKIGFLGGAIFYCMVVIACCYMGITLAKYGIKLEDTEQAFAQFFKQFYPSISIFAIIAGMAAIWSTLDTYLVNGITSISQDLLKKNDSLAKLEDRKLIIISGILVFVTSMLFGLYFQQVLSLILTALLIYISVIIPIAFARKLDMEDKSIFIISIISIFFIVLIELLKVNIPWKALFYPVIASLLMLLSRLLIKSR